MNAIETVKIEKIELVAHIVGLKGVSFATLITETEPSMNKTGNRFHGRIRKISKIAGMIGNWSYKNSVNNQLDREGQTADFEPHPRAWGNRLQGSGIVEHKGQLYVEVKIEGITEDPRYEWNDGTQLTKTELSELKQWLKKSSAPSTQDELEKKVILRDYKLDSIKIVHAFGKKFEIVDRKTSDEKTIPKMPIEFENQYDHRQE